MNTTASECYERKGGCGAMVYPASVKPPMRRRDIQTDSSHSCDAPDCWRHSDTRGDGHSIDGKASFYDYVKGKLSMCLLHFE